MQFASSPAFEPIHRCERESFAEYKMYQSVMGCKFVSYFDKKKHSILIGRASKNSI